MPDKRKKIDLEDYPVVLPSPAKDPSYARQVGLGVAQGLGDIAQLGGMLQGAIQAPLTYGLLDEKQRKEIATPSQKVQAEEFTKKDQGLAEFLAYATDDDLMPPTVLSGQRAAVSEELEKIPEEGDLQEVIRRGTRTVPGLLLGPGAFAGMGARELMGLGGKKIAEKMGFDETGQAMFDLLFSLAPSPKKAIEAGSKLIPKAAKGQFTTQKEMVKAAREMGWSEQEIAQLVREGWFSNLLKKMSPKGASTQRVLDKTAEAVSSGFEHLKKSEGALKEAGNATKRIFTLDVEKIMPEMTVKAEKAIGPELQKLYNSDMTGRDFMTFWQKTNRYFKELPELQAFKGPTGRALRKIDKKLADNFEMANTLSNRFRTVSKGLKPDLMSTLVSVGELGAGLKSLLSFQLPVAAAGVAGTRKLAELMTTNPRFMNLHKKMLTSINSGQVKAAEKIMNSLISLVAKESPEIAAEIRKTSIDELQELMQAAKD